MFCYFTTLVGAFIALMRTQGYSIKQLFRIDEAGICLLLMVMGAAVAGILAPGISTGRGREREYYISHPAALPQVYASCAAVVLGMLGAVWPFIANPSRRAEKWISTRLVELGAPDDRVGPVASNACKESEQLESKRG
ncbi:hypothetical protein [Planctomicrobium sp. SH664]|uniref:hypothetical protein n=1 Tax=Planctomicrobium sp. SH664 TaxID=3448125 RepID=UPI003F5BC2CE